MEGWPRPISAAEAVLRWEAEVEQRQQVRAERQTGAAAAMDGKRKGRLQRRSQPAAGSGGADGEAAA